MEGAEDGIDLEALAFGLVCDYLARNNFKESLEQLQNEVPGGHDWEDAPENSAAMVEALQISADEQAQESRASVLAQVCENLRQQAAAEAKARRERRAMRRAQVEAKQQMRRGSTSSTGGLGSPSSRSATLRNAARIASIVNEDATSAFKIATGGDSDPDYDSDDEDVSIECSDSSDTDIGSLGGHGSDRKMKGSPMQISQEGQGSKEEKPQGNQTNAESNHRHAKANVKEKNLKEMEEMRRRELEAHQEREEEERKAKEIEEMRWRELEAQQEREEEERKAKEMEEEEAIRVAEEAEIRAAEGENIRAAEDEEAAVQAAEEPGSGDKFDELELERLKRREWLQRERDRREQERLEAQRQLDEELAAEGDEEFEEEEGSIKIAGRSSSSGTGGAHGRSRNIPVTKGATQKQTSSVRSRQSSFETASERMVRMLSSLDTKPGVSPTSKAQGGYAKYTFNPMSRGPSKRTDAALRGRRLSPSRLSKAVRGGRGGRTSYKRYEEAPLTDPSKFDLVGRSASRGGRRLAGGVRDTGAADDGQAKKPRRGDYNAFKARQQKAILARAERDRKRWQQQKEQQKVLEEEAEQRKKERLNEFQAHDRIRMPLPEDSAEMMQSLMAARKRYNVEESTANAAEKTPPAKTRTKAANKAAMMTQAKTIEKPLGDEVLMSGLLVGGETVPVSFKDPPMVKSVRSRRPRVVVSKSKYNSPAGHGGRRTNHNSSPHHGSSPAKKATGQVNVGALDIPSLDSVPFTGRRGSSARVDPLALNAQGVVGMLTPKAMPWNNPRKKLEADRSKVSHW